MTAKRKPGAPKGNQNRVIPKENRKRGMTAAMSMPYKEWQMFMAAVDLSAGRACTEDEYLKEWRRLDRKIRTAFIKCWREREVVDPSSMIG